MNVSRWIAAVALTASCLVVTCGAQERLTPETLELRASAIRPTAQELHWQQIPWLSSLTAAANTARNEGRPIFVWTVDEDPFDRC